MDVMRMPAVDMIVYFGKDDKIQKFQYLGEDALWYESINQKQYLSEDVYSVFGMTLNDCILEFQNKLFKTQLIDTPQHSMLLMSQESMMMTLFKATIDKVSEGLQIYDRNGYLLHGNPASEALEGYHIEEFKGRHVLDLYKLSEDFSTTLSVLRTKKPVINRCDRFKAKNDKELVTINSGYPLMVENELYGACVFESDLSVINNIKNRSFNLEAFIRNEQPVMNSHGYTFSKIIHRSEKMAQSIQFAKKIALTHVNVMITGETGTGKEMFAQSIHAFSPRSGKPFVDVNCSAVPSNLVESLFFGTEKGAFTGSLSKKGFFELAEGGTLFLDEINAMSLEMQAKLLRVLQEKRYQRVGGSQYQQCNVRIITACNEDPQSLIEKQMMRKDFFYRISALSVHIPSLKDRKEDIPLLASHFAKQLCRDYDKPELVLPRELIAILTQHDWPGNVRELKHVIEYAVHQANSEDQILKVSYFPEYLMTNQDQAHTTSYTLMDPDEGQFLEDAQHETLNAQMEAFERALIQKVLKSMNGNVSKTARILGISRQSLQYRLRKQQAD
jgi:arginine utilization regulatory protein